MIGIILTIYDRTVIYNWCTLFFCLFYACFDDLLVRSSHLFYQRWSAGTVIESSSCSNNSSGSNNSSSDIIIIVVVVVVIIIIIIINNSETMCNGTGQQAQANVQKLVSFLFYYSHFSGPMTLNKQLPLTLAWASLPAQLSNTSVQLVWRESVKQHSTTPLNSFKQGKPWQRPCVEIRHDTFGACVTDNCPSELGYHSFREL